MVLIGSAPVRADVIVLATLPSIKCTLTVVSVPDTELKNLCHDLATSVDHCKTAGGEVVQTGCH